MAKNIFDLEKNIKLLLSKVLESSKIENNQLFIEVSNKDVYSTIFLLKTNSEFQFKQLIDIIGVDYPEKTDRFKIIYLLLSHKNNLRIVIESTPTANEDIQSIVKIFPSANWMEREIFDMYGISFKDHPDLRRILTDYEFKGFPLRKDFPLTGHTEVRYDEDKKKVIYEKVKLDQNYRDFDFESPWEGTKYAFKQKIEKK